MIDPDVQLRRQSHQVVCPFDSTVQVRILGRPAEGVAWVLLQLTGQWEQAVCETEHGSEYRPVGQIPESDDLWVFENPEQYGRYRDGQSVPTVRITGRSNRLVLSGTAGTEQAIDRVTERLLRLLPGAVQLGRGGQVADV